MEQYIYKICTRQEWDLALSKGTYQGSKDDLRDGFIHFSKSTQLRETAIKHFSGQPDLLLIVVDASKFGEELKWEVSRGGELFPHLYDSLNISLISGQYELPLNPQGEHIFPEEIAE
ncbi:MAG: DUF952 domain-containing protein [Methyloligellaceae bacterium]